MENQTFTVVSSKIVNNAVIDCIYGEGKTWFIGSQICEALEYVDPHKALLELHSGNKERLDALSRECQIDTPSGQQDAVIYNMIGMVELCWSSLKPKSDEVMDTLCDIAKEVAKENYFTGMSKEEMTNFLVSKIREDREIVWRVITPALLDHGMSLQDIISGLDEETALLAQKER